MSDTSSFDPELFLQTETTDSSSTEFTPFPEGEHVAVVKEVKGRLVEGKDGKPSRPVMDVTWECSSPEVQEALGREAGTIRQTVWLDMMAGGGLDMGKGRNVQLGRLREALGQNEPGRPWSPLNLVGGVAQITVTHTPNPNGDGSVFANVTAVATA